MKLTIYHNPRCRKSRETLQLLQDKNASFQVIEYLKQPPTEKELMDVIRKLDISPEKLLRKGEKVYKAHYKGKELTAKEWIKVMVANPILIERPIVISEEKAVIGRPPSNILSLL